MTGMTIGRLAAAAGLGVETIRYYQRRGLIDAPARAHGAGIRRYGEPDVRRLRFIRAAQGAGFTLDEIAELLLLDAQDDRARARELAAIRIALLDQRIAAMTAARDALRRLARQCAAGGTGPCPIITAFEE